MYQRTCTYVSVGKLYVNGLYYMPAMMKIHRTHCAIALSWKLQILCLELSVH